MESITREVMLRKKIEKLTHAAERLRLRMREYAKELKSLQDKRLAAEAEAMLAAKQAPKATRLEAEFDNLLKRGKK